MPEIYDKTSEKITFKLEGENEINVRNFSDMLISTENIFKRITNANNKKASLEVRISAIREGSFEFDLVTFLNSLPELFEGAVTAYKVISAFLEWLKIKDWLRGEKIEKIETNNGDNVIVTKIDGSNNTVTNNLNVNIFLESEKLEQTDNFFMNLGKALPKDRNLILKINNESHNYSKNIKEHLEAPIQIKEKNEETIEITRVTRTIIVKKVDFDMKSKWQFNIAGRLYEVPIKDEKFKEYVTSGKFIAHNGTRIKVDLEERITYNQDKEVVDTNYIILKVYFKEKNSLLF